MATAEQPSQAADVRRPTLVHVMTVAVSLRFLGGQVRYMRSRGFDVHAITSSSEELTEFGRVEGATVHAVEMARSITPLRDLVAVWRLWRIFRRIRPEIVHSHTPKGGLLGTIAAWIARVPVRVYHIHGLPFMTQSGPRRRLLQWTERISCALATRVLAVSFSMRDEALRARITRASKIKVLLGGTGNGIDATRRFRPADAARRAAARLELGIPERATVLGFVGRVVREKGIDELIQAWDALRSEFPDVHLVLVGPFEDHDPVSASASERIRGDARVRWLGYVRDSAPLYDAIDVVVLPTYREGFPNVPLEAAAKELPVVATAVPGCTDAIRDGTTGLLVPPRDPVALTAAIRAYLVDPELRRLHGVAGRERVLREFRQEAVWAALEDEYGSLVALASAPERPTAAPER